MLAELKEKLAEWGEAAGLALFIGTAWIAHQVSRLKDWVVSLFGG